MYSITCIDGLHPSPFLYPCPSPVTLDIFPKRQSMFVFPHVIGLANRRGRRDCVFISVLSLQRPYMFLLIHLSSCHQHEKSMPGLTHWSQEKDQESELLGSSISAKLHLEQTLSRPAATGVCQPRSANLQLTPLTHEKQTTVVATRVMGLPCNITMAPIDTINTAVANSY